MVMDNKKKCYVTLLLALMIILSATACSGSGFRLQNLAKSEADFVADAHYAETQRLMRRLTAKLYRRNPAELSKTRHATIDMRVEQLFGNAGPLMLAELNFQRGTDALNLALDVNYRGDRVLALMTGLNGMIRNAYEYRPEFFMLDRLNEQKLYQSARNIEILVWRLNRARAANGQPLILTNNLPGESSNRSFERLFGKLIALQDMMGVVVSQQNDRVINKVAQNVASMVFFPL